VRITVVKRSLPTMARIGSGDLCYLYQSIGTCTGNIGRAILDSSSKYSMPEARNISNQTPRNVLQSQIQLSSHADTIVCGANCEVLQYTGRNAPRCRTQIRTRRSQVFQPGEIEIPMATPIPERTDMDRRQDRSHVGESKSIAII
jgi:hypothetical protein